MKQNFQVAEWFSNSGILQQQKPLGSLLNPFFNFDYNNNFLRHNKTCQTKMLRRRLETFDLGMKEGICSQRSSTVTVPTPDLTPTLTTSVHTFLLSWSFFYLLCDLTSFDSSLQNIFHQNNFQFSNFILKYLGIKSRFQ